MQQTTGRTNTSSGSRHADVLAELTRSVLYKLWESSWADDAVIKDKENDIYVNPARVRKINHAGQHFSVVGPSIVEPSIQRTPLLYQAGSSAKGIAFGSKHGEALFTVSLAIGQNTANRRTSRTLRRHESRWRSIGRRRFITVGTHTVST